jgi:hypothetical protein
LRPAPVTLYLQGTGLVTSPVFLIAATLLLITLEPRPVIAARSFKPQGFSDAASASRIFLYSGLNNVVSGAPISFLFYCLLSLTVFLAAGRTDTDELDPVTGYLVAFGRRW